MDACTENEHITLQVETYVKLMTNVLEVLAASLPNKQQHAAASKMVRSLFDTELQAALDAKYPTLKETA